MVLGEALQRWAACLGMNSIEACTLAVGDRWMVLGLLCVCIVAACVGRKLMTALLTLRAIALAPVLSRRLSKWVKSYDYSDEGFLRADGAEEPWLERRKKALDRLAIFFQTQYAKSIVWGNDIRESFSDLRFTDANRVPSPLLGRVRGGAPQAPVQKRPCDNHLEGSSTKHYREVTEAMTTLQ